MQTNCSIQPKVHMFACISTNRCRRFQLVYPIWKGLTTCFNGTPVINVLNFIQPGISQNRGYWIQKRHPFSKHANSLAWIHVASRSALIMMLHLCASLWFVSVSFYQKISLTQYTHLWILISCRLPTRLKNILVQLYSLHSDVLM